MFFAGVEIKEGEKIHDAIQHFLFAAADNGIKFSKVMLFGIVEVGSTKFVRFRTDCRTYPPIILRLRTEGRGFISPAKVGGYRVFLANGREGPFNSPQMHTVQAPGYGQVYKGTGAEFWERQFGG